MTGLDGTSPSATEPSRDRVARRTEIALRDILKLEDDTAILDFRCRETGVLLWPLIRIPLIRMVMSDHLYGTSLDGVGASLSLSRTSWSTMIRSIAHNARTSRGQTADVCIMSAAVGNQFVDGRWYNRLTDPFALEFPEETLTIEEPFEWRWQFPRRNKRVRFFAPRLAIGAVVGRLRIAAHHRSAAAALIDLAFARARAHLGWRCRAERREQLIDMLARKLAALPTQFRAYEAMLDAIQPKLLLVTAGCYGPLSPLLAAANRRGIATAEFQHGAVSQGHDAYNVADAMASAPAYREGLPATFFAYGSWWNSQFNVPVTKVVIGNPHRGEQLKALDQPMRPRTEILLLSDGIEFGLYLEQAASIAEAVTALGLSVVLRPHPLERTLVRNRYGDCAGPVRLDYQQDLYSALASAHVVVSEVSTGLFEAVGVVDKVFVWDTAKARFAYPTHPFESYSSVPMLVDLLRQDERGRLGTGTLESVWASGWRERYSDFLSAVGVRGGAHTHEAARRK